MTIEATFMDRLDATGGATSGDPAYGYVVACHPDAELVIPEAHFGWGTVLTYLDVHEALLRGTTNQVGAWKHEGNVYLDIVTVVINRADAIELGKLHHQLAIYDIEAQKELAL